MSGETRTVGVIGWPVTESLSPTIHNAAFAELGLDWVYVPLPVEPDALPAAVAGLAALGFAGANVTMPHKQGAAAACATLSAEAEALRAVNTLVVTGDGVAGHNTDVAGFAAFLRDDAGFEASGRTALVYGAGGAARACVLALARAGASHVTVAVRDPSRASGALGIEGPIRVTSMSEELPAADLVVNATPAGDAVPLPALGPDQVVVDLQYRPRITPLVAKARELGATAHTGLGMLLHQAALSFELWTGRMPPLDVMSAAALADLA